MKAQTNISENGIANKGQQLAQSTTQKECAVNRDVFFVNKLT